jgi:hypothetical protein
MTKSTPCKLHRTHFCSECHWTPAERAKLRGGAVGMDSQPRTIAPVAMDALSAPVRKPVAKDAAPLTAEELQMVRSVLAGAGPTKPARQRVAAPKALDACGQVTINHPLAANVSYSLQSSDELNKLYARLKEEKRTSGYQYDGN